MKYLLDTCVLIAMIKKHERVRSTLIKVGFENCAVSEITLAELVAGAYKGGYERHKAEIAFIKNNFEIIPITAAIDEYGSAKALLEAQGTPVENFDLLIASTAIHEGRVLVTHNTRHFERIPGLILQDWEQH